MTTDILARIRELKNVKVGMAGAALVKREMKGMREMLDAVEKELMYAAVVGADSYERFLDIFQKKLAAMRGMLEK